MKRLLLVLNSVLCVAAVSYAQIRLEKMEIAKGEVYKLIGSDIVVVDTLVMKDQSTIELNREKTDNFIHAKVAIIGKECSIIGTGTKGDPGKDGVNGFTLEGPCKNGIVGKSGTAGKDGQNGVNLSMYFDKLTINGSLTVELNGGDGGDGGKGGSGGGGSPGTRLCTGGNGAPGANGGHGGNAGSGGELTISCKSCPDLRMWLGSKIKVKNYRGNAGLGGDGGLGGSPGLGVAGVPDSDGQPGTKGKNGENGEEGKDGAINFETT